jgi:diguanylate cyclase (GGDEF)-like protein
MVAVKLSGTDFCVGDWLVRPSLGRIERGAEEVRVTPRSMAVLVYLAKAGGRVVSRNELLDTLWPRMTVTQDALSQCIVELRKAFRDASKCPAVIETIPKVGIRLMAFISDRDGPPDVFVGRCVRTANTFGTTDHARFFAAAECTLDDFYIFDSIPDASGAIVDFTFSYINPNAARRLGVRRESLYGKILTEVRPFMIKSGLIHKYREVVRTGIPHTCEVFIDDEMIQTTWLNVQVVRLGNGLAITSRDVTEHRRRSDHVNYLAHHDHLTGLANRTLLRECLRQAILRAESIGQKVAVFLLDIDYFKQINDSLGHADGDVLLATVGQRLLSSVRESDTVARIGGDEFVIVMPEFRTLQDVERCAREIMRNASRPIAIRGREISLTLSVGISIFPEGGRNAEELLRNADTAMYSVKDTGRNSFCALQISEDRF